MFKFKREKKEEKRVNKKQMKEKKREKYKTNNFNRDDERECEIRQTKNEVLVSLRLLPTNKLN